MYLALSSLSPPRAEPRLNTPRATASCWSSALTIATPPSSPAIDSLFNRLTVSNLPLPGFVFVVGTALISALTLGTESGAADASPIPTNGVEPNQADDAATISNPPSLVTWAGFRVTFFFPFHALSVAS